MVRRCAPLRDDERLRSQTEKPRRQTEPLKIPEPSPGTHRGEREPEKRRCRPASGIKGKRRRGRDSQAERRGERNQGAEPDGRRLDRARHHVTGVGGKNCYVPFARWSTIRRFVARLR